MLGPEAAAKAVAALAALAFALVVAHPRARSRSGVSLAVFLGLIAANQALEAARAAGIGRDETLARAAAVVASLDPVALLVFAGTLPSARPARASTLAAATTLAAAFALVGGWALPTSPGARDAYATALTLYTLVVYSAALANVARAARERTELRALVLALAIAAVPLGPRAVDSTIGAVFVGYQGSPILGATLSVGGGALAIAAHVLWGRRVGAPFRALLAGAAVALLLLSFHIAEGIEALGAAAPVEPLAVLGRAGAALRWMLFAALASIAILREDVLGFGPTLRRRAARVLLATAAFALLAMTLSLLVAAFPGSEVRPLDLAILAVLAGATQGSRGLIDRIATLAYALPASSAVAAEDRYREAAARVLAAGGDPERHEALARLRAELGIGPGAARVLHRSAEEAVPTPLVVGALVAGRYRVLEEIPRARGGRSLRARDELMLRDVVLRVAPAHAPAGPAEAVRLASAAQHHNLVTVFNVIARADATLLVQETTEGGSLEQALAREVLDASAVRRILDGILRGLAELHASGIAHGDLREATVLLAADGTPKLVDHGLVQGGPAEDVRAFARLARRLAPDERAPIVDRALAGGFADARALLLAWRAGTV